MAFPTSETLGQPDPRFLDRGRIIDGRARPMEFADQYEAMVTLELSANTPPEVRASFDRGRSIFLFAWYDYELLVPAELQALAAFEMAIQMKLRAIGHEMKGTMHNLIEKGRKCGIIRSEEHTSELQSLMRISYAVFCLKKKQKTQK